MLSQYNYSIEHRKTSDHGNADALSRLPVGPDVNFDEEEGDADMDTVCTIKTVSFQLNPTDPGTQAKESTKDPRSLPMLCAIREKDGHLTTYQKAKRYIRDFSQVVRFSLQNPWLPSIRIKSGDSHNSQAPSTATSSFGTFWDGANEVISVHCSLLARDGCRDNGPLPSVNNLCQTPE